MKQAQSTRLLYAATAMYGNFSMIWAASASRAKSLPVHPEITLGSCVPVQPGPCSHSDVTLTDSRPDNSIHAPPASCQSGWPSRGYWRSCQPVWDVSVKAHPLCHSVSLPGQSDIRLLSPFHPSRLSLSLFLPLSVCPSPACFPSETRQPLNPRSNHRFFGYTFVILKPSGFCNGVLHKHFCRWLRPDIHVVFIAASCIPSALYCTVRHQSFLSSIFPLKFCPLSPPPPLLTHPSSLYLTGDKVWASSWLANRRPVIPVNSFSEPCQARSGQTGPYCDLTKGTEFLEEMLQKLAALWKFCHLYPSNSPLDMDHP